MTREPRWPSRVMKYGQRWRDAPECQGHLLDRVPLGRPYPIYTPSPRHPFSSPVDNFRCNRSCIFSMIRQRLGWISKLVLSITSLSYCDFAIISIILELHVWTICNFCGIWPVFFFFFFCKKKRWTRLRLVILGNVCWTSVRLFAKISIFWVLGERGRIEKSELIRRKEKNIKDWLNAAEMEASC